MMKKTICLLLICITTLFLFACGNADTAETPTEHIYWYITDNGKTLHLSSSVPKDSNFSSWQDDWSSVSEALSPMYMGYMNPAIAKYFNPGDIAESNYNDVVNAYNFLINNFDYSNFINISTVAIDNIIYPKTCRYMFANLIKLQKIENFENINSKFSTDFTSMFLNCENLSAIDISHLYFDKVALKYRNTPGGECGMYPAIDQLFYNCKNLSTIFSNKDIIIKGITLETDLFNGCENLVGGNGTPYNSNKVDISMAVIDSDYQTGYFTYDSSRYYWKDGCYYINGVKQINCWITDKFDMFYVDKNGKKVTSTWKDGRYLDNEGKMLRNTKTPDGKFVNYEGDVVDTDSDYANIDENAVVGNAWYRTDNGIWYYFEGDRTTLKKGWFDDPQDGQRYYLDSETGIMLTGWQEIDGDTYYFNERPSVIPNWYYVPENDTWASYGHKIKALGSMFRNEQTPDGNYVDNDGVRDGDNKGGENVSNDDISNKINTMKATKDYSNGTTFDKMDTVTIGSYTQNGSKAPIEWVLLNKQNDKALLISKYVLDCKPYNNTSTSVNWDNCTLNKWLNFDFKNSAFSNDEKNSITNVLVPSISDMNNYFNDDDARKSTATKYAKDNGCWISSQYIINGEGTACYFLSDNGDTGDKAAFVGDSGKIGTWGSRVDLDDCGIRPAIWVTINGTASISEKKSSGGSASSGSIDSVSSSNDSAGSGSTSSGTSNSGSTGIGSKSNGLTFGSTSGFANNTLTERQQLMQKLHDAIKNKDKYYYSVGDGGYSELGLNDSAFTDAKFDSDGNLWLVDVGTMDGKGSGFEVIDKNSSSNNVYYYSYLPMSDGTAGKLQLTKNSQTISEEEYESAWSKFESMSGNSESGETYNGTKLSNNSTGSNNLLSQINSVLLVRDYPEDTAYKDMNAVTFGNYYQNSNTTKEPIEWLVLGKDDGKVLLLSKYVLDGKPFNENETDIVSWKDCSLRKWLNETFINEAFSANERSNIVDTNIISNHYYNEHFEIPTTDKIFILSSEDCDEYIPKGNLKFAYPTKFASEIEDINIGFDLYDDPLACKYWTRNSRRNRYSSFDDELYLEVMTEPVGQDDGVYVSNEIYGVRPAMWVKYK